LNFSLFILLNFFSAFGVFQFFNEDNNQKKLRESKALKVLIILIITLGFIGNYYVSRYILSKWIYIKTAQKYSWPPFNKCIGLYKNCKKKLLWKWVYLI
jgi:hypothetical protein